jgi:signal transduction histidine kinase/streptogramin lyase
VVPGFNGAAVRSQGLRMDRNHSLWVGSESDGLYRIHDGVADHYGIANGLTGNNINFIYEDREGDLWVTTDKGIDFFRDTPVLTFSTSEGLAGGMVSSILALKNGSVWVGNQQELDIIQEGRISAIAAGHGLPGQNVSGMFEDSTGRIWLGIDDTVMTYKDGRFFEVKKSDGTPLGHIGTTSTFAEDVEGNIWALAASSLNGPRRVRLLRMKGQRLEENISADDIISTPAYLAADLDAGLWIGSYDGPLARYRNGHTEVIALGNSERHATSFDLSVDSDDGVWVPTANGLYRWKDGRQNLMDSRNGLPCPQILSAIKDNDGSLWLYSQCGLLKISAADLANWLALPESQVSFRKFGPLDGAFPSQSGAGDQPRASKSPDGRLWFAMAATAQMIDPSPSHINLIPPPVHVEELIADRKSYLPDASLRLPPLTRDLEIDYSGLSFVVPQNVRFRYRLEGRDAGWQEPGTRRQAFYSDLRPGKYRFRVIACNNDGVWNEVGASLDFSVAPAWYQTNWFRVLCAAIFFLIAWTIYRLRVRQIARVMSARFDERLYERTRMARDLHDTFLQTIQGSKLVADDALDPSTDPARMRRAMEQLSAWLGRATQEGRAAVNALRTSATEENDLAAAFRRAMEECRIHTSMETSLSVLGEAREMHPIVRDEVYRIGYEAIRNACVHSHATQLRVELTYDQDLALRISDNGVGVDPAIADRGKEGHFGLQGMRERAVRIAGKLTIVGAANSGTEIKLVVPGGIIYRKMSSGPQSLPAKIKSFLKSDGSDLEPN